jgi:hypothetical protein
MFGSFRDVVSSNKILYATRFLVNWAFLIALEALKLSLRRVLLLPLGQLEKPKISIFLYVVDNCVCREIWFHISTEYYWLPIFGIIKNNTF